MLTPLRSLAAHRRRGTTHGRPAPIGPPPCGSPSPRKDATKSPWPHSPPESSLAAGQPVRQPAKVLGGVRDAAQGALVLEPLPIALLLRLAGLGLRSPGLLPLPCLRFGLCFPLLGPALGLLGLVAHEGAVGLLGLAHRLVHLPASFPRGSVVLDTREGSGGYTRGPMRGARNGRPRLLTGGPCGERLPLGCYYPASLW